MEPLWHIYYQLVSCSLVRQAFNLQYKQLLCGNNGEQNTFWDCLGPEHIYVSHISISLLEKEGFSSSQPQIFGIIVLYRWMLKCVVSEIALTPVKDMCSSEKGSYIPRFNTRRKIYCGEPLRLFRARKSSLGVHQTVDGS